MSNLYSRHPHPPTVSPDSVRGRLKGRRIIVTGAASGIGRAVAEWFHAAGAQVALLDRNLPAPLPDGSGSLHVVDIRDAEAVQSAIAAAAFALGGIDGLVNAAGIANSDLAEDIELEDWQRLVDVNLTGTFLVCRACLPYLREQPGATIVSIASGLGLMPFKRRSAYAATKAGVIAFSKAIAMEWAPTIRVNTICPGTVDTPMVRAEYGEEVLHQEVAPRYALQRIALPEEIALAALYLSSPESAFVTGIALAVDGGRTFH